MVVPDVRVHGVDILVEEVHDRDPLPRRAGYLRDAGLGAEGSQVGLPWAEEERR